MTDTLADLANSQWLASYRKMIREYGGDWRDFGRVHAYLGGLPLPFANGVLVVEPALASDLDDAIEWVSRATVPYRVRVDDRLDGSLMDVPQRYGLVRDPLAMPGMVMSPITEPPEPPEPPEPASGVTTVRVGWAEYAEFERLIVDTGTPARWARRAFPPALIEDPDSAMFVGRLHGKPAATSLLIRTAAHAGIFAVGTIETARRRGLGTAVTWAAIAVAREWGCSAVILQASAMGFPIYRRMGFEPVVSYVRFMSPEAAPD